jgi:hypothetical protein
MSSDDLASALQQFSESQQGARPRQVAAVLALFGVVTLLLEAESLSTWLRRKEPGAVQGVGLVVLDGVSDVAHALRLDRPRRALADAAHGISSWAGLHTDEAWGHAVEPAVEIEPAVALEPEPEPELTLEETAPPPAPIPPEEKPAPEPEATTVLLAGDSMIAGGLAATLSRALAARGGMRVVHAFRIGTGLTSPEVFDWAAEVPPLVAREDPRLVVCSLGANDARAMRVGDRVLPFGDAEWKRVYLEHVVALMRAFAALGARVLWVGLPPMRDEQLSRRAQILNRLFSQAADRVPRVEYLEVSMLVSGADQGYATFGTMKTGARVRLRLDDGVHYSRSGSALITRWVMDWVRERMPPRAAR